MISVLEWDNGWLAVSGADLPRQNVGKNVDNFLVAATNVVTETKSYFISNLPEEDQLFFAVGGQP